MFLLKALFLISGIIVSCSSAYTAKYKCDISDGECQNKLYANIIWEHASTGLPEMGIPPFDPYVQDNTDIMIAGIVKMNIAAVVKGLKTCRSTQFNTDAINSVTTVELLCDVLSIEGQYDMKAPMVGALLGQPGMDVHGKGNGTIVLEKIQINAEIPFKIKKWDDGKLHLTLYKGDSLPTMKVLGKPSFYVDNLYIGKQEVSDFAVQMMNTNREFTADILGRTIMDSAMNLFIENGNKFYAYVPITDLISGDLSSIISKSNTKNK